LSENSREALEMAERFADGLATLELLQRARDATQQAAEGGYTEHLDTESDYDPDAPYAVAAAFFATCTRLFPVHYFSRGWCRGGADGAAFYAAEVAGQRAVEGRTLTLPQEVYQTAWDGASRSEAGVQCRLLRDIFGNPFHPVIFDPASLLWNDGTISRLAQAIYGDRAFDRLPILADALEESGCDNSDILNHCRYPGEHVRGCWVVDLCLGKS
jgi:hypothetical protein